MTQTRKLVILMSGVSPADLALGSSSWLETYFQGAGRVTNLRTEIGRPAQDQVIEHLPAGIIRDLGHDTDQRSIILRSRGQSDDTIMRQLPHRTAGPADLTILWLRDHSRSAIEFGLQSNQFRDALGRLERHVQVAYEHLQSSGSRVELSLLTTAALRPVQQTFDPVSVLRQGICQDLHARCSIHRRLSYLRIESPSSTDSLRIEQILCGSPFKDYGRILSAEEKIALGSPYRSGEITFIPHDGVAFAERRVQSAPRFLSREDSSAVLPWLTDPVETLELAEVGRTILEQFVGNKQRPAEAQELDEVLEAADLTPLALSTKLRQV